MSNYDTQYLNIVENILGLSIDKSKDLHFNIRCDIILRIMDIYVEIPKERGKNDGN